MIKYDVITFVLFLLFSFFEIIFYFVGIQSISTFLLPTKYVILENEEGTFNVAKVQYLFFIPTKKLEIISRYGYYCGHSDISGALRQLDNILEEKEKRKKLGELCKYPIIHQIADAEQLAEND